MRRGVLAVAVFALFLAAPASAEIFATFDDTSTSPAGIRSVNAVTGAALSLPPNVDDPLFSESHPSLSPFGKYLVFKREARGVVRIVMVERATGRSADLFSSSDQSFLGQPNTPTFSLDGNTVITGRRFECCNGKGGLTAKVTETNVRSFPTGPFPKSSFNPRVFPIGSPESEPQTGRTLQPVQWKPTSFSTFFSVFGLQYDGGNPPGRVAPSPTEAGGVLADPSRQFADPTVGGPGVDVVVLTSTPVAAPIVAQLPARSKLVSFTLSASTQTTDLPTVVNAPNAVLSSPEFTRDGRYLGFIRNGRLFIWDTQTQLLLNTNGVPASPNPTEGALALEVRPVLTSTTLTSGSVTFSLSGGSRTGLLVQRIVGRKRVLGRNAPKLKKVGRVPLGKFSKGRHRKHWGLAVRGHKLRRGCYLVTVRALTRKKQVRDLSKPYTVRIRKHKRPRVRKGVRLRTCRRGKR